MFDVSFGELSLIAIVALLVFGPDKLPELARSLGLWIGRIRRYASTVKQDIDRELRLQEWKQSIEFEERHSFKQLAEETKNSLNPVPETPSQTTSNLTEKKPNIP